MDSRDETITLEEELLRPEVLDVCIQKAAAHVRERIVAGRIAAEYNKKRHRISLPSPCALPEQTVVDFWNDDSGQDCDSLAANHASMPSLRILVEFLKEIPRWSGSVFKVRLSEYFEDNATTVNDYHQVEYVYAVKIRISDELPRADASDERAFATMKLMQDFSRTRSLCPFPVLYIRQVKMPRMSKNQIKAFHAQPGMHRPLPPISALICTWIEGERVPTPLSMTSSSWENWWMPLIKLRASIAIIRKPRLMSTSKVSPNFRHIRDNLDHDEWLNNLDSRINALSYVYKTKKLQGLIPRWLEDYLGAKVSETSLPQIEHIGRRLGLCLSKQRALKRDGEAESDLRLFVADPSLDNFLKLDEHRGRMCVLDLENSGWADPAYIVSEMMTHNVWLDKPGVDDNVFPFELGFIDFVALTFARMIRIEASDFARYKERLALHLEFCICRGLLFHIRGSLQELGQMIDGSRTAAFMPGSGSGSGAGSARLGGNSGKWSPTRMGGGIRHPKHGRTSVNAYGFVQHFRSTHRRGIEVFRKMLEGSDYSRRTLNSMIEVQSFLDEIQDAKRKENERAEIVKRNLLLAQSGLLGQGHG